MAPRASNAFLNIYGSGPISATYWMIILMSTFRTKSSFFNSRAMRRKFPTPWNGSDQSWEWPTKFVETWSAFQRTSATSRPSSRRLFPESGGGGFSFFKSGFKLCPSVVCRKSTTTATTKTSSTTSKGGRQKLLMKRRKKWRLWKVRKISSRQNRCWYWSLSRLPFACFYCQVSSP